MQHAPAPEGEPATAASAATNSARITILLCTYNGARFLAAQLASLERQLHQNWKLIVSDDGSSDATLPIVHHFAQRIPQDVEVREGPRRGPSANFLSLAIDPAIDGDYFAFCDQDDVWDPDKLTSALSAISRVPAQIPAVYGARTRVIGAGGEPRGFSRRFGKRPSFGNALVQSIAGANTMLFNRAAKELMQRAGETDAVSHDWWAYQLISGSGGVFRYDAVPHLDYRQHDANRIGSNRGLDAQLKRLRMVLSGSFAGWNDMNFAALHRARHCLTPEACALLDRYRTMREAGLWRRLLVFARSPFRRQSLLGNVALLVGVVLKKV
jgi:glycosyltransferase involved in cell wall biosynthesis